MSPQIASFDEIGFAKLLRQLSLVMQSSVDPAELQEAILQSLVHEMGYERAIIGLQNDQLTGLTGWLVLECHSDGSNGEIAHIETISLEQNSGPLLEAIQTLQPLEVLDGCMPTQSPHLNERLVIGPHYLILPMHVVGQLIGVLLIDRLPGNDPLPAMAKFSLEHLASYASIALNSNRACIHRAQQSAILEERNRIAAELHDNVSQALYGLAYGLDACQQMLDDKPSIQKTIQQLHGTVLEAQSQMRQLIFDMQADTITADSFVAGLHRHLRTVTPMQTIALRIEVPGQFELWPSNIRQQLYRVAQEALANAAKHAQPNHIIIKLRHTPTCLELRIADDGEGFDPATLDYDAHFGLQSMARRMETLNGQFEISSMYGEGTFIIAKVPRI